MVLPKSKLTAIAYKVWNSPTLMTWGSMFSKALALAVLLPLVLTHYTSEEANVWLIFNTIASIQLLLDVGMTPTFSRIVSYAIAGKDISATSLTTQSSSQMNLGVLQRVTATMTYIYLGLGFLSILIMATLGSFLLVKPLSTLTDPLVGWLCWIVVLTTNALFLMGNVFVAYLQGTNNIPRLKRWDIVIATLSVISTSCVIFLDGSFLWVVIVNSIWLPITVVRNYFLSKDIYNIVFFKMALFDKGIFLASWPSIWRSGLGILMSQGIIQGSGLVYAQIVSVKETASYLLALRIIQMISYFSQAPFYSRIPQLVVHYAKNDNKSVIDSTIKGMHLSYWVFVVGVLAVSLLATPLLGFIGSNTEFVPNSLWFLIGGAFLIERYGAMHMQLFSITNRIIWHIANGVTGVITLILAYIFYPLVAVYALPIALALGYASFYSWYAALHSYKQFSMGFWLFEQKTLFFPLMFFLLSIGIWWFL